MFLHEEEHQDRRQRCNNRAGAHQVIHGAKLRVKAGDPSGHRLGIFALGQHNGPEIIIPDEGKDQNRQRRNRRFHERQDHKPKYPPFRDPFNPGRFDQLIGQGLDEIAHKKGAKSSLKRDVKQDEPGLGIIQPHIKGQVAHGHHEDLKGHEIAGNEHEEDQQIAAEFVNAQCKAGHTAERDRSNHRWDGDEKGIPYS